MLYSNQQEVKHIIIKGLEVEQFAHQVLEQELTRHKETLLLLVEIEGQVEVDLVGECVQRVHHDAQVGLTNLQLVYHLGHSGEVLPCLLLAEHLLEGVLYEAQEQFFQSIVTYEVGLDHAEQLYVHFVIQFEVVLNYEMTVLLVECLVSSDLLFYLLFYAPHHPSIELSSLGAFLLHPLYAAYLLVVLD